MNGIMEELKNKHVRICFMTEHYIGGGVVAADYDVLGCADGFLKLLDEQGRTVYCRLDRIKRITVLPATDGGAA